MSYFDLFMWYIAYGEAAGGKWDYERSNWIPQEDQ